MPDYAMCKGTGCEKKNECARYRWKPSEYRQSYFAEPPIEEGECDEFIPMEGWGHYGFRSINEIESSGSD